MRVWCGKNKIVDTVFAVSRCVLWNKKKLTFFIIVPNYKRFWSETPPNSKLNTQNPKLTLPSLLVGNSHPILQFTNQLTFLLSSGA
jgi:hypothetical protein